MHIILIGPFTSLRLFSFIGMLLFNCNKLENIETRVTWIAHPSLPLDLMT